MEELNKQQFWNGISILLHNYHAVNKKIFACVFKQVLKITKGLTALYELDAESIIQGKGYESVCNSCASNECELKGYLTFEQDSSFGCEGLLVTFRFLTKKAERNIDAIGIIDFSNTTYTCKFNDSRLDDFCIKYCDIDVEIDILSQRLNVETSAHWAKFILQPKLLKWCKNSHTTDGDTCNKRTKPIQSLQLIDIEIYNNLYKELKLKFAEKAMEFWHAADQTLDPLKFIYEDLAIAAYLITLWRSEHNSTKDCSQKEPYFADLGCGNGLLVYILNEVGYQGYGYDIRARKLWSYYPERVKQKLLEQAVVPNAFTLPAEVNWLIGNHCDELTAWMPVMAACASLEMSYFVLPCCAYELSGGKFQRRNTKTSTYQDLLKYTKYISDEICGFKTLEDRLKIPSTKRLALVGINRTYAQNEYLHKKLEIKQFITEEINKYATENNTDEIKLREKSEAVRNCTKIEKNILALLVKEIFNLLLNKHSNKEAYGQVTWQPGGRLTIREIALNLTKEDLKNIKSECGGLKTLLRNHHEIFEFCGGDVIGIRKPQVLSSSRIKPQTIKKRPCYFKQHHPNGCPLRDEECTFLH